MPDTGWVIAGSGTTAVLGTEDWANPSNITADDGNNADGSAASKNEQMYYLIGYNFGLSVPAGTTILGIEARLQASDDVPSAYITHVIVGKNDSTLGDDLESSYTDVTSTPTDYDYGSSTELWGLSWSYSDVNASTFQVRISMNAGLNYGNPSVDYIAVKVYYEYVVSADYGSFSITGQAVGLTSQRVLESAYGAFAVAGQNAALSVAVPAEYGSFSVNGQSVGFIVNRVIQCEYGSIALTGQLVTLAAQRLFVIDYGSLSLTGQSVGLSIAIPADYGSFTLTGQAAALVITRAIIAAYGAYALTGITTPIWMSKPLPVDTGYYILNGMPVKLSWSGATAPDFQTLLGKPPNQKLVNPATGLINHEWDIFFKNLVERVNALNPNILVH